MKNKVFLSSLAVLAIVLCIAGCKTPPPPVDCTYEADPVCFCEKNPTDARCDGGGTIDPPSTLLPDSIANGTNFYNIFSDATTETELGNRVVVPTMLRDYDVWPMGETLVGAERLGINAWGFPEAWIAFDVAGDLGWNGGGIIAVLDQFDPDNMPDLSAIDGSYTFHIAIKSPTNQLTAGTSIFFLSEDGSDGPKYYLGPDGDSRPQDQIWLGNYAHDGEWHHFEIPVSDLKNGGWLWTAPLVYQEGVRQYLLSFQGNPHIVGAEINLDAIFFYKKPAQ